MYIYIANNYHVIDSVVGVRHTGRQSVTSRTNGNADTQTRWPMLQVKWQAPTY